MSAVTIWHNPRCSKSRQTLALLKDRGHTPQVRLYLDTPPGIADLRTVATKLGPPGARRMIRSGEATYRALGLDEGANDAVLLEAMAAHPILIERPIVICGEKAGIGRPPEAVLAIVPDISA